MDGQTDGRITDKLMDGWVGGRMAGQMDGWMPGNMEEWTNPEINEGFILIYLWDHAVQLQWSVLRFPKHFQSFASLSDQAISRRSSTPEQWDSEMHRCKSVFTLSCVCVCIMCVCMCLCVCVCERERECMSVYARVEALLRTDSPS